MLSLQILISTIDDRINNLPSTLPKKTKGISYIICHQSSGPSMESIFQNRDDIKYIQDIGRGLSRSRNLCLQHASADILLISDDDVIYKENFAKDIINAFNRYQEADIICFQAMVEGSSSLYKKYPPNIMWLKNFKKYSPSSIEVAIRYSSLHNLPKFNEKFGVGSEYPIAEDSIFMIEVLRNGANVLFYPAVIVSHPFESTRLKKFSCPQTVKAVGAYYAHLYPKPIALLRIIYNALKNKKKYSSSFSFYKYLSYLIRGYKDYSYVKGNTQSSDK